MTLIITWFGVVWLFLGIYALTTLAFALVWLFFKVRGAYQALRCVELPRSDTVPPGTQVVFHASGPIGDPEALGSTRVYHRETKQQRRVNKQHRLRRVQEHWVSHGLAGALR